MGKCGYRSPISGVILIQCGPLPRVNGGNNPYNGLPINRYTAAVISPPVNGLITLLITWALPPPRMPVTHEGLGWDSRS